MLPPSYRRGGVPLREDHPIFTVFSGRKQRSEEERFKPTAAAQGRPAHGRGPVRPAAEDKKKTRLPACMKLICSGKGEGRALPPLFMFHDSTGLVEHFRSMSSTLTRVCYGIQLIDEAPLSSLQSLAGYYASVIHAAYPEGDVVLGGFSFGVKIAAVAARDLEALGRTVTTLVCVEDSIEVDRAYTCCENREPVVQGMLNLLVQPSAPCREALAHTLRTCSDRDSIEAAVLGVGDAEYSPILSSLARSRHTAIGRQLARSMGSIVAAMARKDFFNSDLRELRLSCSALVVRSTVEKRVQFAKIANLVGQGSQPVATKLYDHEHDHEHDHDVPKRQQQHPYISPQSSEEDMHATGTKPGPDDERITFDDDLGVHRSVGGCVQTLILDAQHQDMFQPTNGKLIGRFISAFAS